MGQAAATTIKAEHTITPDMWSDFWITLIEGRQANYWARWFTVREKVRVGRRSTWRHSYYTEDGIWGREWRVRVDILDEDGRTIGFTDPRPCGLGPHTVRKFYMVGPQDFQRAAEVDPGLFALFLNSERDSQFDAVDAERILQLCCFGKEIFG